MQTLKRLCIRAVQDAKAFGTSRFVMKKMSPPCCGVLPGPACKRVMASAGVGHQVSGAVDCMNVCVYRGSRRLSSQTGWRACWHCGSSLTHTPVYFCPQCEVIQPPDHCTNYFTIMACEKSFAVDTQQLQHRYLQLQRSLHPDNFSQKTQQEQENSVNQSAMVNKAYNTLLKPMTRGLYLLELEGVHLEEGTDIGADPQFLQEIMELNERLAEGESREATTIKISISEKLQDLIGKLNTSFQKGDLQTAKVLLAKMKYFVNIEEKVKEKLGASQ